MKIFVGADHEGYEYKGQLIQALQLAGHEAIDVGNQAINPNDNYPEFAKALVTQLRGSGDGLAKGILISGNGQGMCMAANRFKGVRASLCWNQNAARSARSDEDSNVLCLSSRYLSLDEAGSIMATWLATPFSGEANASRRLQQIDQ